MKIQKIITSAILGAICFLVTAGAENIIKSNAEKPDSVKQWSGGVSVSDQAPKSGEKSFLVQGKKNIRLEKSFNIFPNATYTISASFKGLNGNKNLFYLGLVTFDKDNKEILSQYVNVYKATETTLIEACKKWDKILKVENASKWKIVANAFIAFNVDGSGKMLDIPNRNVFSCGVTGIVKKGDIWEVTLARPVSKPFPAGTKIREHYSGGTYTYILTGKLPNKWKTFSKKIKGSKLRCGSKYAKLIILANYGGRTRKSEMLFDDISIDKE